MGMRLGNISSYSEIFYFNSRELVKLKTSSRNQTRLVFLSFKQPLCPIVTALHSEPYFWIQSRGFVKVTSISSASMVQILTAALERQVCAHHIASQLDRKVIFRKQFGTSSIWLPVEKWCHVPGDFCLQSWVNATTSSGFLLKTPRRVCWGFLSFFPCLCSYSCCSG